MMLEKKTTEFLEVLGSSAPTPGGGAASAAVGAFATALGRMVTNLTIGKKKYADVEDEVIEIHEKLEKLEQKLVKLVDMDAEAFLPVAAAYKLPKGEEKDHVMEEALYGASIVPLQIMETIYEVMQLLEILGEKGSKLALSDVGVGILFAQAALEGASLNVIINAGMMKNQDTANELRAKMNTFILDGESIRVRTYRSVLEKIS